MKSYARKIGLAPGSLVHIGEKKTTETTIALFDPDVAEFNVVTSPEALLPIKNSKELHWINVTGLQDVHGIGILGTIFKIHPLILEDILHTNQRPKIQFFDDYIFIVLKMIHLKDDEEELLSIDQVSLILGPNYVLTFLEQEETVLEPLKKRIQKGKNYYFHHADFLAYCILDVIIDHYFLVLEEVSEAIEGLEVSVVESKDISVSSDIHAVKRDLLMIRKATWPLREAIGALIRDKHPLVSDKLSPFLHDLYDHTIQVIDSAETARDMTSALVDIYLSSISVRMNEVMKTLTIIATIFIPLTFIVGVYGMNFKNMPELDWHYGYYYLWGIMITLTVGMLAYFKRKGWF